MSLKFTDSEIGIVKYLKERIERHTVDDELLLPPPMAIPLMLAKAQRLIQAGAFSQKTADELARAANGFPDEIMRILRHDAALCKPAGQFEDECEVRMLWYGSRPAHSTHHVKCPDAIKLCHRI